MTDETAETPQSIPSKSGERETLEHARVVAWQPIETAPQNETGRFLFAHFTARRLDWATDATWHELKRCWGRWDGERLTHSFIPTHWMPLPAPPASEHLSTRQALVEGEGQ